MSDSIIGVCCACGRKLTPEDYEAGRVVIEEIVNPYTDEVEDYKVWCVNCHDEEYGEFDDEAYWEEDDDC